MQRESLTHQAGQDVIETPESPDRLRVLANVRKTDVAVCRYIGSFFTPRIELVYVDMLGLYRLSSGIISETVHSFCTYSAVEPLLSHSDVNAAYQT